MKQRIVNDSRQKVGKPKNNSGISLLLIIAIILPAFVFFSIPAPADFSISAIGGQGQSSYPADNGSDRFTVNGTVVDDSSSAPIGGAILAMKGGRRTARSAADGSFSLVFTDRDNLTLICTADGYASTETAVTPGLGPIIIRLRRQHAITAPVPAKDSTNLVSMLEGKIPGISRPAKTRSQNWRARKTANARVADTRMKTRQVPQAMLMETEMMAAPGRYDHSHDPSFNTEGYDAITENRFLSALHHPLSTFSIDVDGASYSNVRRFLRAGQLPPAGSVRIEELINYFPYEYSEPRGEHPFAIHTELAASPWKSGYNLVRIGLQGKKMPAANLPAANLVFLIDVSGSMMSENKLPLVKSSMKLLVDQLREQDRVAIVVYAGSAGTVLPSTSASQSAVIREAIDRLETGGSTAGGAGIRLAYRIARQHFLSAGNNRIILCTDGDFNIGASSDAEMEKMISEERASGIYLTVLGYGMGNYKDNKMQKLANKGNGNHAYIDNLAEARKVLVNEFGGTLFTIANDVKLQVEFNPALVQAYRLIGYENRMLQREDFNNDKKDAGELGSGHTVTALYEIIPVGVKTDLTGEADSLKYQRTQRLPAGHSDELMTIKFRYKKPGESQSRLITQTVANRTASMQEASAGFRFAAAVAEYGMILSNSEFRGQASFENAERLASSALGQDLGGYRREFLELIRTAAKLHAEWSRAGTP